MEDTKKSILRRIYLAYVIIFILCLIIIGKVIYIQFYQGNKWKAKAKEETLRYRNINGIRGNIFASDGSLLATSIPIFNVYWDSQLISNNLFNKNVNSLSDSLSCLFRNKSKREYIYDLKKARKTKNRYYLIKRKINYSMLRRMKTFPIFKLGKYRGGMIAEPITKRVTPFGLLAFRTIGWDKKGTKNDVGLEGAYSSILKGESVNRLEQKIAYGQWRPLDDKNEIEPKNGKDIITTIDINIQDVAEDALLKELKKNKAYQGCAVLMEVHTGQIKAIANLNLDSTDGKYKELYNFAIAEKIEPGSTFKLASIISALEDKKIKLKDTINTGNGTFKYFNRTMRDVHKIRNGKITVREAFEKSSNVGVSKIIYNAYKNNPKKFIEHLYKMSLDKPLCLEIAGETKPYIINPDDKKNWCKTSLPWMSVGYGVQLTPLQILTFYNAVANNGKMVKPMFVKEIKQTGKIIKVFKPSIINKSICSESTIKKAQQLLEGVVERGTARALKNSIYKIAGKTGTAKISEGKSGYGKYYNATFVGFFPSDKPKYSCIVVINKPSKGLYYGSAVAAPVFKEIADKVYAAQLCIHQKEKKKKNNPYIPLVTVGNREDLITFYKTMGFPIDTTSSYSDWVVIFENKHSVKFGTRKFKKGIIPNVKGMDAKDAIYLLENLGMQVIIKGRGIVKNQSISSGNKIIKGSKIILKLSTT